MRKIKLYVIATLFTFCVVSSAIAQDVNRPQIASEPAITVAGSGERVRFTAPNSVVQMHLQVYDNVGQLVFDVSSKGNVFDWTLQDSGGGRLNPGSYLFVVTVKSLSEKINRRIGSVSVQEKQIELQRVDATQLTAGQQQAVGPIEENAALTILQAGETEAATVIAHDGTQGEVARTRGALSFRLGDFLSGKDEEQMRLTEDGRLGIGTDNPQATLDVAGTIRASKGIEFADGTVQTTGLSGRKDKEGNMVANVAGTGSANLVAKWTDNSGTLGDSAITEVGGRVGIGANDPTYRLVVGPDIGPGLTTSDLTISRGPGQSVSIFAGANGSHGMNFGWDEGNLRAFVNAPVESPITFTHGGVSERMRIATNGNVGIGTNAPAATLHVTGTQPPPSSGNGTNAPDVLRVVGAKGGNTSSPSPRALAGTGGNVLIQAGDGGDSSVPVTGVGGSITLQPGAGGGPTLGFAGNVLLAPANGHVGIGTNSPIGNLHINVPSLPSPISAMAINVQSFQTGSAIASHFFRVRDVGAVGASAFLIRGDGNVGIGTESPAERLSVAGKVESTAGGFKFPDGSVQTSAANAAFTTFRQDLIPLSNTSDTSVLHLNLPAGTYLLTATASVYNNTYQLGQNNARWVECKFSGQTASYGSNQGGDTGFTLTMHTVMNISSGSVDLTCRYGNDPGSVYPLDRRLTAVKIENVSEQ